MEREAWEHCDHGFAPTSAAELLTPAILEQLPPAKPPATPEQPKPAPELAEEESAPQVVDLVEVRTALSKASQVGHTDQVRALIQQAGASKLSEVDPAKYAWLLGKVQELSS